MKKIFSLMIAIMAMFTMNAQTFESSRFIDNTYFRVEGGASALTHPKCNGYNGYENWGHTIQGVIGAEVGKWVTPKFGVAFEGDFGIRNNSEYGKFNYFDGQSDTNGLFIGSSDSKEKARRFNYINVTGLVKFNVSNIFDGWNPNRKWEFVLATGPMWIHGFPSNIHHKNDGSESKEHGNHYYKNDFGVKFKAEVNYNINQRFQLNLIPEFNYNLTGAEESANKHPKFDSRNSWYALKVGVTYKMGKQFTECPYKYTQADVDKLNAEINDLRARQPETVTKVVTKEVAVKTVYQPVYVVAFDFSKAELDQAGRDVLNAIPTDAVVDVQGEASYPGSKNFNQKLSERRATVVSDYLTNRGIKVANCNGIGETGHQIVKVVVK